MMIAPLLLSAAAGYWVLERAEHQKGRVRTLGRITAVLILLLSAGGVVCHLTACRSGYMGKWGGRMKPSGCPLMGGGTQAPAMPEPTK